MPKWREMWREISAEAEEARTLMVRDRAKGEEQFGVLIAKHGEDGMILMKRGKAYQQLGDLHLAYTDYLVAEDLFPMQEWKDSARQAAAKLEPKLPAHAANKRLKTGLDSLELDQEVQRLAQEVFRFADLSAQASIDFACTAVLAVSKKMGVRDSNPRGAIAPNYLEQAIDDLERGGKISEVTAHEMHTIRRIRNAVRQRRRTVTSHDARACAFLLLAILRAVSPSKKN